MFDGVDRALSRWNLRHRDAEADAARRPDPSREEGTDCLEQVRHIVVLMMENHSFDNYFGTLGHGDGLNPLAGGCGPSNERIDGAPIYPFHLQTTHQESGDPTQSWHASHIQYGSGGNDGFVRSIEQTVPGGDPRIPMGYWTEDDLPFYAGLARTFALADRWHCSLLGPTFPNRRFLIAATADGLIDDVFTGMFDRPRSGTVFDLLDRHNIPWRNYHHVSRTRVLARRPLGRPSLRAGRAIRLLASAARKEVKTGLADLQFTADLYPLELTRCLRHLRPVERFFQDAAGGQLPAVSIVDPDFQSGSEENPQDVRIGEGFAAAVIDAVMHGKGWGQTLLIWLYDEHGGYYDHVPPAPAAEPDGVQPHSLLDRRARVRWVLRRLGKWNELEVADSGGGHYDRYGFRVPAVVVSPYARPGHVSSTVYDHTSVLKLIERKWNLPPLTRRDESALDPLDMVDFTTASFMDPPLLPPPAMPWATR